MLKSVDISAQNAYTKTIKFTSDRGAETISSFLRDTKEENERPTAEAGPWVHGRAGLQIKNLQTVALGWRAINDVE
ncbi:hypothetical protein DW089_06085 [Acidaminococcus sp. AM05-11]|nr:hypothetical protein DW089_06085 [Acidaminococcus sp. AM05-11]